jgi:hypothetical protein
VSLSIGNQDLAFRAVFLQRRLNVTYQCLYFAQTFQHSAQYFRATLLLVVFLEKGCEPDFSCNLHWLDIQRAIYLFRGIHTVAFLASIIDLQH